MLRDVRGAVKDGSWASSQHGMIQKHSKSIAALQAAAKLPSKGVPADSIEGVEILQPDAVAEIITYPRPAGLSDKCCWKEFQVAYDTEGYPILVSMFDFHCDPDVHVQHAKDLPDSGWTTADIFPDKHTRDPEEAKLKGNGFPGTRGSNLRASKDIITCLKPAIDIVWPSFDFDALAEQQHDFGLVSPERQPRKTWLDSQRMPHNDIKWEHGVRQQGDYQGTVPPSLATVYTLNNRFNNTGTSIWRTKATARDAGEKLSLLRTLPQNEAGQGAMNPHVNARRETFCYEPVLTPSLPPEPPGPTPSLPPGQHRATHHPTHHPLFTRHYCCTAVLLSLVHKHLNVRKEIPDPHPQSITSHAWAEAIMLAMCRFNRIVLYDGRRLHNQYLGPEAYDRLSLSPHTGRLTMNSFFWMHANSMDRKNVPQDVPRQSSLVRV
jgi:hypothetical protein